jgi:hypothetical protein
MNAVKGGDLGTVTIEEEMKRSYLEYAMSVIVVGHCQIYAMDLNLFTGEFFSLWNS